DPLDEAVAPIGSPRALAHPGLGSRIGLGDGAGTAAATRCASSAGNGGTQTMSAGFRAVQWNRAKLVYDGILLAGVVLYIGAYLALVYWLDPPKDQPAAIDL